LSSRRIRPTANARRRARRIRECAVTVLDRIHRGPGGRRRNAGVRASPRASTSAFSRRRRYLDAQGKPSRRHCRASIARRPPRWLLRTPRLSPANGERVGTTYTPPKPEQRAPCDGRICCSDCGTSLSQLTASDGSRAKLSTRIVWFLRRVRHRANPPWEDSLFYNRRARARAASSTLMSPHMAF